MIAALAFYGCLAGAALYATWHNRELRMIGLALVMGFTVSNFAWSMLPAHERPGIYTMVEMFVILWAYLAWIERKSAFLVGIVCASIVSICANIAFALQLEPGASVPLELRRIHVIATNACFVVECLLTIWLGVSDGVRGGRLYRWAHLRGHRVEPNASAKAD